MYAIRSYYASDIDNGSFDACGIELMELSKITFSSQDTGINVVILTVTDVNGNSAQNTATVTIADTIAPVASCKDITVQIGDTYIIRRNNFVQHTLYEVIRGAKVRRPGGLRVSLTAQDLSGNLNADLFYVTVKDTIAPEVITKDITVSLDINGEASITPSDIDNGSFDACGIELMA